MTNRLKVDDAGGRILWKAGLWRLSLALLVVFIGSLAGARPAGAQQVVAGSKPFVTILCRYADVPDTPQPKAWFEGVMGSAAPGLNHWWGEVSNGAINLNGSLVVGWYNLPSPKATYFPNGNFDYNKALQDAAAVADADVYFPSFYGINLVFNAPDGGNLGVYGSTLTRDGQTKIYGVTWIATLQQAYIGHEMGHALGLDHSGQTADAGPEWDADGTSLDDPTYGGVRAHYNGYHKDFLGWIPAARRYTAAAGSSQTIVLERSALPPANSNYLLAKIPLGASTTQFYTVEARKKVGYDAAIAGDCVVIHRVKVGDNEDDSSVAGPAGKLLPTLSESMWTVGETFSDAANGISVAVTGATATGFNVSITKGTNSEVAPLVTITDPAATVNPVLSSIGGTSASNKAGVAVTAVRLLLRRVEAGDYWNSASGTWVAGGTTPPAIATTVDASGRWTSGTAPLPAGATLTLGNYQIIAQATDAGGRRGNEITRSFSITVSRPALTVQTPANNSTIGSLSAIAGTASAVNGLSAIWVYLYRSSDGLWWNGSAWTSSFFALAVARDGNNWSVSTPLPAGALLLDGDYQVIARADDNAGNDSGWVYDLFRVSSRPALSIADASRSEGSSGTSNLVFTARLSMASTSTVSVSYATANGTATSSDYQAATGTLSFAPGETSKSISVPIIGDLTFEPNETFAVNLSGAVNASLADAQAMGTILNDDFLPVISSFTPGSGLAGASVVLTGNYLGGASAVMFNGKSATTFTVNSPTQITASVPAGASSGPLSVTTAAGTGKSTSNFVVPAPAAPTSLSATTASSSQINLRWTDNATNESGFKIERSPDGTTWTYLTAIGANLTTYSNTGLSAATRCFYRVRAYISGGGNSAYSNAANALTSTSSGEIIIDNTAASGVTVSGTWSATTYTPGFYGSNYLSDGNADKGTKRVRFTPNLAAPGTYQVFARWTAATSRAARVPIDIVHATGSATVFVNQQAQGGQWVLLGTYSFNAGTSGSILIRTDGTSGYVVADAVRLLKTAS